MPNIRPAGPYPIPGIGLETWLVRFDKNGVCSSPQTKDALVTNLAAKADSPIILFSHGWNNDFADAVDLYRRFLSELEKILATKPLPPPPPIFVGLTWPSVWLPSDYGPQMAGQGPDADQGQSILDELVSELPPLTNRLASPLCAAGDSSAFRRTGARARTNACACVAPKQ